MPYLVKKKLLHANRKDLRVNYYWLPFWQWIGLRTLIPHLARKYKKILILQSNRQNKLRQGFFVHGHFIISYSIIFIRVTKPKYLGYFLAKISSSITVPFFFFNLASTLLIPTIITQCKSSPLQVGHLSSCFQFHRYFPNLYVLREGKYAICWEKTTKPWNLHISLLKSSCIRQTLLLCNIMLSISSCYSEIKTKNVQYCRC